MTRFVDSIIAYRILKMLVTPFEDTEAFKLGIIDAKGKELKRMNQLTTVDEKDAYTILHRLVFRLKKIVEKVPIDNKKLANFAAALALVKENYNLGVEPIDLEFQFTEKLKTNLSEEIEELNKLINTNSILTFKQFNEEIPANNAGTPGVDGFTPDTVFVHKKKKLYRRDEVNYDSMDKRILRNIQKARS